MQSDTITICSCKSRSFINKEKVATIASCLKNNGYKVKIIEDLCAMVADMPEKVNDLAQGTIMACHSRAISSQLNKLSIESAKYVNIRTLSSDEVLNQYHLSNEGQTASPSYDEILKEIQDLPVHEGKDAWYPVIDKTRCTNCGKCNDFCLFGVYTVKDKQVLVSNPHNCKNNCPACARMCPSQAIIFPKYEKSPINGGTEIEEVFSEDDVEAMYQKRLQYRLQQNRNRFSLLKKDQ